MYGRMSCPCRMCCLPLLAVLIAVYVKYARSLPAKSTLKERASQPGTDTDQREGGRRPKLDAFASDDELSGDFERLDFPEEIKGDSEWTVNLNLTKNGTLYEGDICLNPVQKLHIKVQETFRTKRSARIPLQQYLWKDNTVYYKFGSGLHRNTKTAIKRAIKHWKKALVGCLKFIRLDKSADFEQQISREKFNSLVVDHIEFSGETPGCWSLVGRQGEKQLISFGDRGCANTGTAIHEIGHAIGFWHEQSRRDRDEYIKVMKENIMLEQKDQFRRMRQGETDSLGYAYDFGSIMHYGPKFFTANGKATIKVKGKFKHLETGLGQRNKLSFLDIAQVRAMYKCNVLPSLESKTKCIQRSSKGRDYRGELDYTEQGAMCQPWNEIYPHKSSYNWKASVEGLGSHNFCRNPLGSRKKPWCYTTLTDSEWQYCDLKFCDEVTSHT